MPRLFTYVMTSDTGFAPHVDHQGKYLTLATCKPRIRSAANEKDWILGVAGRTLSRKCGKDVEGHLIYLAEVSETPNYDSYYSDPRFKGRLDTFTIAQETNGFKRKTISMTSAIKPMIQKLTEY